MTDGIIHIKELARKYYNKYRKYYIMDSIDVDDLIQEGNLLILQLKQKYKKNSFEDFQKIAYGSLHKKFLQLRRNATYNYNNFVTHDITKNSEDHVLDNLESFQFINTGDTQNIKNLLNILSEKEYYILTEVLINKRSFKSLALHYNVSSTQIIRLYNKILIKLKYCLKLDI